MFGLGVPELILILIIGLVVFGPGKLPELGRAVGKSIKELKNASETSADKASTMVSVQKDDIDIKQEVK